MRGGALPLVFFSLAAAHLLGCASSGPETSGTKTNWFRSCDSDSPCDEDGDCICGFCTLSCSATDRCVQGSCGSALATASVCVDHRSPPARVCLPDSGDGSGVESSDGACSEFPILNDFELGEPLAPDCDYPGALVCEGFDKPFDTALSTWVGDGASAALQDCIVHSGAGAIRFKGTGTDSYVQTRYPLPRAISSGSFHARLFVNLPTETDLPEQIILFELWGDEPGGPERITMQLGSDGSPSVFVGTAESGVNVPISLPRDEWVCLELSQLIDDSDGVVSLSVNGSIAAERSGIDTQGETPFVVAVTSGLFTGDAVEAEIYLDDFVLATEPIGCK